MNRGRTLIMDDFLSVRLKLSRVIRLDHIGLLTEGL